MIYYFIEEKLLTSRGTEGGLWPTFRPAPLTYYPPQTLLSTSPHVHP